MTQSNMNNSSPATPEVKKISGVSLIWLIPVITLFIGAWLIAKTVNEKGPSVTLTFKTADGIEAGKTHIKYKNVDVGLVDSVEFNKDFSEIVLTASMVKEAIPFLKRSTRFWVVRPRLSLKGVSGLGTLVSGSYIELEPGEGAEQRHFTGLEIPPVVKADVAGKKLILSTNNLGSLSTGSPVYYQGIPAGEVLGYELGNDSKSIFVHLFVNAPYDELVKGNTRFWNVSGIDVSLDSDGFNLHTASMQSLLMGGVAFETPDSLEKNNENIEDLVFTLHDDHSSILENTFTKKARFVMFFDGSVRGLKIGAPVEFKGIKIGSVTDIRLEFDMKDSSFRIPVLVDIEPERIIPRGENKTATPYEVVKTLVERGLRAQLNTGSLLTGQLFIELDMHPDTEIKLVSEQDTIPELPTIPASLQEITTSVKSFLAKLNKLKLEEIGDELLGTLSGSNKLLNAPELNDSITELKKSLIVFRSLLGKLDKHAEPMSKNIEKAMGSGHEALEQFQVTLSLLDNVLKSESPMQYRLIQMADEMTEAARSLNTLLELLEQNPQSLIFGKQAGDE